jgi:hypothetical protein
MTISFSLEDVPNVATEIDIMRSDDGEEFCYVIKEGEYKGISYVYGGLNFEDQGDKGIAVDYVPVVLHNEFNTTVDMEAFSDYTGKILEKVILSALETMMEKDKNGE